MNNKQVKINSCVSFTPKMCTKDKGKKYKCMCCGDSWETAKGHFFKSNSPLYNGNDNYVPLCTTCRDTYIEYLTDLYSGDIELAFKHFCQQYDIAFDTDALKLSATMSLKSRFGAYLQTRNLDQRQSKRNTYIDSIIYDYEINQLNTKDEENDENDENTTPTPTATDVFTVTHKIIAHWGVGFKDEEYKALEEHYNLLKEQNPNCDSNQEIFINDLCFINMLKLNAIRLGDVDKVSKLTKEYRDTFKQAGLKTVNDDDKSKDDCWGLWCKQISEFTPEEYYKDKKLFDDYDSIKDYIERFVKRSLKNLQFGSKDRDKEFYVKDGDANDL